MDLDEVTRFIIIILFFTLIQFCWKKEVNICILQQLQVECIMSILIYKNLVKGYFAHKSKVVVLSKQDPFPKLNGKPVNS